MEALNFFMWFLCILLMLSFIYTIAQRPFLNDFKRSLWKVGISLCIFILGILSFIDFPGKGTGEDLWPLLILVVAVFMGIIAMRIIDQKFHDIMYKETHFFRITDIVDNKASGVLNISGTSESIKARLVCPLHASYTIGNIIPVKVILCQVNEVIVEPN